MDNLQQQPTIGIDGDWTTLFDPPVKESIETEILPAYLPAQRWFAGKARRITKTSLVGWGGLPADPSRLFLVFVKVEFASGPAEIYFVPLAVRPLGSGGEPAPNSRLARLESSRERLTSSGEEAWLVDGLADDHFSQGLLASIAGCEQFPMITGTAQAATTTAFDALRGDPALPLVVRSGTASSSNSLLFLGERLLLKIFRRLEPGMNPDLEIGRFLTEHTDFTAHPRVAGSLLYHPRDRGEVTTLAILQELVPHQGDGWTHALDELRTYYQRVLPLEARPDRHSDEHVVALARRPVAREIAELIGTSLDSALLLGQRTAQMHAALASRDDDPAFAPEPLDGTDMELVAADLRAQAGRAFSELRDHRDMLPDSQQEAIDWLLTDGAGKLDAVLSDRASTLPPSMKTRIHGDYHLGQVLRVHDDYVLLDFEGEPTRSITERRRKYSPIRDVAGMLRSYHYAAFAGAFALAEGRGSDLPRLIGWAELWQCHVGAAFLRAYLESAGPADFVPEADHDLAALLDRFVLGKSFYELVYELNHRPEWARIPISGVVTLLGGPSRFP